MQKNYLAINKVSALVGFCGAFFLFFSTVLFVSLIGLPFSDFDSNANTNTVFMISMLISLLSGIPTIVLFSIALSRSKQAGLSIKGHVLGIVGAGSYFLVPYLVDFLSIGLLVIGAMMVLKLKKRSFVNRVAKTS